GYICREPRGAGRVHERRSDRKAKRSCLGWRHLSLPLRLSLGSLSRANLFVMGFAIFMW
ncbi:unnamed protein product, partial [Ectocarpus sp. 8 AP-2014]